MPPSGYTQVQADAISEFLRSCAADLRREAVSADRSPLESLRREFSDIHRALTNGYADPFGTPVLQLTAAFYASVADRQPMDWPEFEAAVAAAVRDVADATLAIHVVPAVA